MSEEKCRNEQASGARPVAPSYGSTTDADRRMGSDCCGAGVRQAMAGCPGHSFMKRHPILASAMLVGMGLAVLVIPAGAVMGIIAFFRTI